MLGIFLVFAVLSDLEFEDDDPMQGLPFEPDVPAEEPVPDQDAEVKANEAELTGTPTPPPVVLVKKSLAEIVSYREAIAVAAVVVYFCIYFSARQTIKSKLRKLSNSLLLSLNRHFEVVPHKFEEINNHQYSVWITGRTNYKGALVSPSFKHTCDPLGAVYAVFMGESDMVTLEFVLLPPSLTSGIVHVGKEKPSFAEKLKLKSCSIGNRLSMWTDLDASREPFVAAVRSFAEENPGVIQLIELSDTNRFETRGECRFVARFELKIIGSIEEFATDALVDFCVKLADAFTLLKLPADVRARNEILRDKLIKEKQNEGKKEEEKKLTPEEEEKIQRRRERKEQMRTTPKIKMVKG